MNTLIPAGSQLYLTTPADINDRSEIAGYGLDAAGNTHAFLLIPRDCDNHLDQDTDSSETADGVMPVPVVQRPIDDSAANAARALLRPALGFSRFAGRLGTQGSAVGPAPAAAQP